MHSSRMRTGRSLTICRSLLLRGGAGSDPPQFPLGCGPGSDPPQFPPWVLAWILSPSISPLGVGMEGGASFWGGLLGRGVSFPGGCLLGRGGLLGRGVSLARGCLLRRGSPSWGVSLGPPSWGGCV